MQEFIGKYCLIYIKSRKDNKEVYYKGIVKRITDTQIFFIDKFNNPHIHLIEDISSCRAIRQKEEEENKKDEYKME